MSLWQADLRDGTKPSFHQTLCHWRKNSPKKELEAQPWRLSNDSFGKVIEAAPVIPEPAAEELPDIGESRADQQVEKMILTLANTV